MVKTNVKRVAFERRKLIKLSTETIKYDKYPFASMDCSNSEHKFKPLNLRHSATQLDIKYETQNVQSFEYQVEKMRNRDERHQRAKMNSLIELFKMEFKKR